MPEKMPSIDELLAVAIANGASDLHLRAGTPPTVRVDGELRTFAGRSLNELEVELYLQALIPDRLEVSFKETHEADFAYGLREGSRFRINAYRQRGRVSLAIRVLRPPLVTLTRSVFPRAECDRRRSQGTCSRHGTDRFRKVHDTRGAARSHQCDAASQHHHRGRSHRGTPRRQAVDGEPAKWAWIRAGSPKQCDGCSDRIPMSS